MTFVQGIERAFGQAEQPTTWVVASQTVTVAAEPSVTAVPHLYLVDPRSTSLLTLLDRQSVRDDP